MCLYILKLVGNVLLLESSRDFVRLLCEHSSRCMPALSLYTLYSKIATWLILPVVICLSQRLSHACLSSSENKVKPRMAHYISYGSLDRTYYLDNCGNSRANTCVGLQPS